MNLKSKIIVTPEGDIDLSVYEWDDQHFSEAVIRHNPLEMDKGARNQPFHAQDDRCNEHPARDADAGR